MLYVATSANAQTGSDFAVVGLVHGFVLFGADHHARRGQRRALQPRGDPRRRGASRRIDPVDAVVYILAQLSGGVLGALLVKGLLLDEGRASHYGAATISPLLGGNFAGAWSRGSATFCWCWPSARWRSTRGPARSGRRSRSAPRSASTSWSSARSPAALQPGALVRARAGRQRVRRTSGPTSSARSSARCSPRPSYRFVIAGSQYALGPRAADGAPAEVVENVAADVSTRRARAAPQVAAGSRCV